MTQRNLLVALIFGLVAVMGFIFGPGLLGTKEPAPVSPGPVGVGPAADDEGHVARHDVQRQRATEAGSTFVESFAAAPAELRTQFQDRFREYHDSDKGLIATFEYETNHQNDNLKSSRGRYLATGVREHNAMNSAFGPVGIEAFPDLLFSNEYHLCNQLRGQGQLMASKQSLLNRGVEDPLSQLLIPARVKYEPLTIPLDMYVEYYTGKPADSLSQGCKDRLAMLRDKTLFDHANVYQEFMYIRVSARAVANEMNLQFRDEEQFFADAIPEFRELMIQLRVLEGHFRDTIAQELEADGVPVTRRFSL